MYPTSWFITKDDFTGTAFGRQEPQIFKWAPEALLDSDFEQLLLCEHNSATLTITTPSYYLFVKLMRKNSIGIITPKDPIAVTITDS